MPYTGKSTSKSQVSHVHEKARVCVPKRGGRSHDATHASPTGKLLIHGYSGHNILSSALDDCLFLSHSLYKTRVGSRHECNTSFWYPEQPFANHITLSIPISSFFIMSSRQEREDVFFEDDFEQQIEKHNAGGKSYMSKMSLTPPGWFDWKDTTNIAAGRPKDEQEASSARPPEKRNLYILADR
jgi:hypothetical protein